MKKLIIAIWSILVCGIAYSQPVPKTGMGCANEIIYDSGGVSIEANEVKVLTPACGSNRDMRVCIFKCNFIIKNILSVPVTLISYDFMIDPRNMGFAHDAYCDPQSYGKIERYGSDVHLGASSTMVVTIYGETLYDNNPKCCYKWIFGGFTVNNLVQTKK